MTPVRDIRFVRSGDGGLNGTAGAGFLNVVNSRTYRLLLTKPLALCRFEELTADVYWMSYNPAVDGQCLQYFCRETLIRLLKYDKSSEVGNILKIEVSFD